MRHERSILVGVVSLLTRGEVSNNCVISAGSIASMIFIGGWSPLTTADHEIRRNSGYILTLPELCLARVTCRHYVLGHFTVAVISCIIPRVWPRLCHFPVIIFFRAQVYKSLDTPLKRNHLIPYQRNKLTHLFWYKFCVVNKFPVETSWMTAENIIEWGGAFNFPGMTCFKMNQNKDIFL